jgi:thiol-disulfide isomerase/thioredoxin
MKLLCILLCLSVAWGADEKDKALAANPAWQAWQDSILKREKLSNLHQEFLTAFSRHSASGRQASERQTVVDFAGSQWRQQLVSGSGTVVEIFDGSDLLRFEPGSPEFERKSFAKAKAQVLPFPYSYIAGDWAKARVIGRQSCGFKTSETQCVELLLPLKSFSSGNELRMVEGYLQFLIDETNGPIVSLRQTQRFEGSRTAFQMENSYRLRRMSYNGAADPLLFRVPTEVTQEVKKLSEWDAKKIRKQLAGKPAPDLSVTTLTGAPLQLSALKGKTVLLDFWATWCPPCRADDPALNKLYDKFGGKDLEIIGISVSEDRQVVEKYLAAHPHRYPIVLTTDNEMPRPYQVRVFPTYIVVGPDGNLAAVAEGDQGFRELRRLLKQSGLDVD